MPLHEHPEFAAKEAELKAALRKLDELLAWATEVEPLEGAVWTASAAGTSCR